MLHKFRKYFLYMIYFIISWKKRSKTPNQNCSYQNTSVYECLNLYVYIYRLYRLRRLAFIWSKVSFAVDNLLQDKKGGDTMSLSSLPKDPYCQTWASSKVLHNNRFWATRIQRFPRPSPGRRTTFTLNILN